MQNGRRAGNGEHGVKRKREGQERTGTGRIRKKRRHKLNANKRYRQQYGTRQMETDGNKTEHIETSHQLDGTRKARKLERKRDGKGMRTGRELDGTGRGPLSPNNFTHCVKILKSRVL